MKIAYSLTVEDNMAFVRHQYETMPAIQRSRKRSLAVASILFPFIGVLAYVEESWLVLGGGLVLAAAYVWFVGYFHRRGFLKRMERLLRERKGDSPDESVELTLVDDELHLKTDTTEATATLDRFSQMDETDEYTFLYVNEQKAIIIPRLTLKEGSYGEFVGELKTAYGRSHQGGQ